MSFEDRTSNHAWPGHRGWYLAIGVVILSGFFIGMFGWFSVAFLDPTWIPETVPDRARQLLSVMALGVAGASIQCSIFFAKEINQKVEQGHQVRLPDPNFTDVFGYTFQLVGGGVTALVLYLAILAGVLVFTTDEGMTTEAGWLVGLVGGVGTQRVKSFLMGFASKLTGHGRSPDSVDRTRSNLQKTADKEPGS